MQTYQVKCAECGHWCNTSETSHGTCVDCLAAALRRSRSEQAGTLYRVGNLLSELGYELTRTREPMTDGQLLAAARTAYAAAARQWALEQKLERAQRMGGLPD